MGGAVKGVGGQFDESEINAMGKFILIYVSKLDMARSADSPPILYANGIIIFSTLLFSSETTIWKLVHLTSEHNDP